VGYIYAAKALAIETMNGPNDKAERQYQFSSIDTVALSDESYGAGVSVAAAYKIKRKEPISFEGVPTDSVAWKI
jgi:hypothetical protein